MKTTLLIQLHKKGLHILELIEDADKRKMFYLENINGFPSHDTSTFITNRH